jgi:hypothetical protein
MAAKSQKILASMMGPDPVQNAPAEGASSAGEHDEDLNVNFGHDRYARYGVKFSKTSKN